MIVETLGIIGGIMGVASLMVAARQGSFRAEIDNLRARVVELERNLKESQAEAKELRAQNRAIRDEMESMRDKRMQALEESEQLHRVACGKLDCPMRVQHAGSS